jgi:hypothetical protein
MPPSYDGGFFILYKLILFIILIKLMGLLKHNNIFIFYYVNKSSIFNYGIK